MSANESRKTVLGLDIGTNSIGWALINNATNKIIDCGARIFPEGVDRDTSGGEKSKNQSRREARGIRRQIRRHRQRMLRIKKGLCDAGLLPLGEQETDALLKIANPYELRSRALDQKISLHEMGRILMHLSQRRGFKSNRKTDKAADKETKGMLAEISELAGAIEESGARTLGEYLYSLQKINTNTVKVRIRARHTQRGMYENEFEQIWDTQQAHHPDDVLSDDLKLMLHDIIFFQRDMYWPEESVGKCELEPGQLRCERALRQAQQFRILQEVNNLRLIDQGSLKERKLSVEERAELLEYLQYARKRTFDQIRKKLNLHEKTTFNLEAGGKSYIEGNLTDAVLSSSKKAGKKWKAFSETQRNAVVEMILHDDDEETASATLVNDYGLTSDEAEACLYTSLPEGRMNFSLIAIEKLLPNLGKGLLLMGKDSSDSAMHAAGYLRPDQRRIKTQQFLPGPPKLPNPIIQQALHDTRKVVNAIIREYGVPERITVELARDAKNSARRRRDIGIENARRAKIRVEVSDRLQESGVQPTRGTINRYLLWEEQDKTCVYCGSKISQVQLLGGDVDVDHILPRWRSLDDSMMNKVVCHRHCNNEKKDQTPREWLESSDPSRYEQVLQRAMQLPYPKHRRFLEADVKLDDFVNRQLTDTAYISRCVGQYLKSLDAAVGFTRGSATSMLRHHWGMNSILGDSESGKKTRDDHRHHAVDALVIAATSYGTIKGLARSRGKSVPKPWDRFRDDAERAVKSIVVSHRVRRGIKGALHEETFYGATQKKDVAAECERPWAEGWVEDSNTYVRRKPVAEIKNNKHLDKVRDPAIRQALLNHLVDQGVDVGGESFTVPKGAFEGDKTPAMPSGVPIKRIRMLEPKTTLRPVSPKRRYHNIQTGSNHHISYYESRRSNGSVLWSAVVVPMLDVAQRALAGLPLVDTSGFADKQFLFSLSIGEAFQIDGQDGERVLCVLRKMRQDNCTIFYKMHADARPVKQLDGDKLYLTPKRLQQLHGAKVTVDTLGRIRRAND